MSQPLTEQKLTAAIYDALVDFQRTAQLSSLQHAQMRQHLAEHLTSALALRTGVVPTPAAIRADAFRELADRADPQRPEVSWFGDFGHQVGAWIRKQAEYEQRAAPEATSAPLGAYQPSEAPVEPDTATRPPTGLLGDPRRTLTPTEYDAAWHAVEGAAGDEGADPGTILHAVLDRLGIDWQDAASTV